MFGGLALPQSVSCLLNCFYPQWVWSPTLEFPRRSASIRTLAICLKTLASDPTGLSGNRRLKRDNCHANECYCCPRDIPLR